MFPRDKFRPCYTRWRPTKGPGKYTLTVWSNMVSIINARTYRSHRFILGLLNGIMGAVRTLIHEICGPEDVVKGMAYIGGKILRHEVAFCDVSRL